MGYLTPRYAPPYQPQVGRIIVFFDRDRRMQYKGKHIDPYESFYWNTTPEFFQGQLGGGISRTVKTDDSLAVMEASIIDDTFGFEAEPRMYNDVAPTLRSERSGLKVLEPSVMTPKRTEFGKSVRKEYEKGELDISRHAMTVLTPREDGISNTLTSVQKDNLVCEPLFIPEATAGGYAEAAEGDSVNLEQPSSKTRRGRVGNQMANTLTTSCNQGVVVSEPKIQSHYRIRKLTPRECFRLMNVDEDVIDQIQAAGISNSQQYKLAGNSIVVACLEKIFEQMFFPQYTNSRTLFG